MKGSVYRLAVLTSHPIQYQAPLWRLLAAHPAIDLTVYFCTDFGVVRRKDREFGVSLIWDLPLLEGYRHRFLRNLSPRPGPTFFGKINPGILPELWRGKYDALFVHGHLEITNWMAFLGARLFGIPVLLRTIASLNYDTVVPRPVWLKWMKKCCLRILYRHFVKGFLSIGTRNRDFYLEYGVPRKFIFHCPYAVDNEFFRKESRERRSTAGELKSALRLPSEAFVILFAAKFIPKKDPFLVLRAYESLSDYPDKALVMAGDGRLRPELEGYVRNRGLRNVRFVGFLNQGEMARYYALADVLVRSDAPDKGDWGATVNEALASGLPVICTDALGSQVDLILEGKTGFVYPVGDLPALTRRLRRLMGDRSLHESMRGHCIQRMADWGYPEAVEGFLQALRACCRKGRAVSAAPEGREETVLLDS